MIKQGYHTGDIFGSNMYHPESVNSRLMWGYMIVSLIVQETFQQQQQQQQIVFFLSLAHSHIE